MMLPLFIAAAITVAGTGAQQGVFYDMQAGIPSGIETKCDGTSFLGSWREDEAANHQLTEGGKVAVSQRGVISCMRAPVMEIQSDYKFTIQLFVSENGNINAKDMILQVFFVEEGTSVFKMLTIFRSDIKTGWHNITKNMPPRMDFSKNHQIEITSSDLINYVAIRWFGISNEELPPPTTTTPAAEPETSVNTTSEAITTTTAGEDQSTSSPTELITTTTVQAQTELSTTSREPITDTTPKPPAQVVSVFPELWSTLLGIAIGIIAMCVLFFVATCCRLCLFGKRTGRQRIDSGFRLPRLHVVSTPSQKSITGSIDTHSSASTADPFWVKSKAWSHIP
ncbi:uncharacterized protein LOC135935372 isoform X2 [Cloeon dipterum]|uniref:uncharacterized protein LOC135935372 isoform X2 n=1 Tax=Cloeon dipterum TaxID=197152 RepID=UPI00321FFBE1